ncbi:hypothetical protein AA042_10545 [Pseudomonas lundensis]|nr:hypothetical protein AA042_10545 [Pseudomonas lundensis]
MMATPVARTAKEVARRSLVLIVAEMVAGTIRMRRSCANATAAKVRGWSTQTPVTIVVVRELSFVSLAKVQACCPKMTA